MLRNLLICAMGVFLLVFPGCGGGDGGEKKESPPPAAKADSAETSQKENPASAVPAKGKGNTESGKKLYLSTCATCHGDKGDGKGPAGKGLSPSPRDFTDSKAMSSITDGQMFKAIRGGGAAVGKSPVMPGQPQFSDKQIWDIIAYERAFDKEHKQ